MVDDPKPAGLEVELFNEQVFRELRAYAQVPDSFIDEGWSLDNLKQGGGKGGTLMARVGTEYIVKELSKGDHQTLLEITGSYAQHVRGGDTLLCPVYAHFQDKASGRCFFGMRNVVGTGPFAALYDLKGCADDKLLEKEGKSIEPVHKRIWKASMWLGQAMWTEQRKVYYRGKVEARSVDVALSQAQREKVLISIDRDTKWLAENRLMDYSLLVAIKDADGGASASCGRSPSTMAGTPFSVKSPDGRSVMVTLTIIDFLQKWTMGKRVARCIKCMECNKATVPPAAYGKRFASHFHIHLVPVAGGGDESPSFGMEGSPGGARRPVAGAVAPPSGDCGDEGLPEETPAREAVPKCLPVSPTCGCFLSL